MRETMQKRLAALADRLRSRFKCGGEGSNKPGPCPEGEEGSKPSKPSSGGGRRPGGSGKPASGGKPSGYAVAQRLAAGLSRLPECSRRAAESLTAALFSRASAKYGEEAARSTASAALAGVTRIGTVGELLAVAGLASLVAGFGEDVQVDGQANARGSKFSALLASKLDSPAICPGDREALESAIASLSRKYLRRRFAKLQRRLHAKTDDRQGHHHAPAGQPTGGQFTSEGGGSGGGTPEKPAKPPKPSPADRQAARRAAAYARDEASTRQAAANAAAAENRIHKREVVSLTRPSGGVWDDEHRLAVESQVVHVLGGAGQRAVAQSYRVNTANNGADYGVTQFWAGGRHRGNVYTRGGNVYVDASTVGGDRRVQIAPGEDREKQRAKIAKVLGVKLQGEPADGQEAARKLREARKGFTEALGGKPKNDLGKRLESGEAVWGELLRADPDAFGVDAVDTEGVGKRLEADATQGRALVEEVAERSAAAVEGLAGVLGAEGLQALSGVRDAEIQTVFARLSRVERAARNVGRAVAAWQKASGERGDAWVEASDALLQSSERYEEALGALHGSASLPKLRRAGEKLLKGEAGEAGGAEKASPMRRLKVLLARLKSRDASGHEHKPGGRPDGGQFTGTGDGGGGGGASKPEKPARGPRTGTEPAAKPAARRPADSRGAAPAPPAPPGDRTTDQQTAGAGVSTPGGDSSLAPGTILKQREMKSRGDAKKSLRSSKTAESKPLSQGINAKRLIKTEDGTLLVFKPSSGEGCVYPGEEDKGRQDVRTGIPKGEFYRREVAASRVAEVLGMDDLVPATTFRTEGSDRGSAQAFVGNALDAFRLQDPYDGDTDLARAAAFDYLMASTDRHNGNWMLESGSKLSLIDNGLSLPEAIYPTDYSGKHMLLLRKGVEKGLGLPDLSGARWDRVQKVLLGSGISKEAVGLAKARFDALLAAHKDGKTLADLPDAFGNDGTLKARFARVSREEAEAEAKRQAKLGGGDGKPEGKPDQKPGEKPSEKPAPDAPLAPTVRKPKGG